MFLRKIIENHYWGLIVGIFFVLLMADWALFWREPAHDLSNLLFRYKGEYALRYIRYNVANALAVTAHILIMFQISSLFFLAFSFIYELLSKNNKA